MNQSDVVGDVCTNGARIGSGAQQLGDLVLTQDQPPCASFGPSVMMQGDVLTAGAPLCGSPRDTLLPGLDLSYIPGGTSMDQVDPANGGYDTTGDSPRLDECRNATVSLGESEALLAELVSDRDFGVVRLGDWGLLHLEAETPGGVNVLDFRSLQTGRNAVLTLDGGGVPGTSFILRVERNFMLGLAARIEFVNEARPENLLIFSLGKCSVRKGAVGGGTLFCPNGDIRLNDYVNWRGALVGGRGYVDLGESTTLEHAPLVITDR